ncbi:hypothetical protein, partial [Streptomyces mangrovisoli]|uniref:hypothetical protein n=1 Tax=Streptomyces mangrovisoli TaxID=1428628 RepID=UPI0019D1D95D
ARMTRPHIPDLPPTPRTAPPLPLRRPRDIHVRAADPSWTGTRPRPASDDRRCTRRPAADRGRPQRA